MRKISLLLTAIVALAGTDAVQGGRADFPSPTWSVRACPAGADAPKKNWNGISPQVLSLIHISEPTRRYHTSRMPSSA